MRRTAAATAPISGDPHEILRAERASATPSAPAAEPAAAFHARLRAPARPSPAAAPNELAGLQRWFFEVISHPGTVEEGVAAGERAHGRSRDPRIALAPSASLSPQNRLGIYHFAYRARLIDCLADDFPAVRDQLGLADFEALCREVIAARPSRTPNLNAYGAALAAHCRARAGGIGGSLFIAELASLEWAMVEVFHAGDAPALDAQALHAVPLARWATMRFAPGPHLRLLRSRYPVNAHYQAWRGGARLAMPTALRSATAVWRENDRIWRMDLDEGMADLLAALLSGAALGQALARRRLGARKQALDALMRSFQDWVAHGFFAPLL